MIELAPEQYTEPDQQLEIIESLKPRIGGFIREVLPQFGIQYRHVENFRLVDEVAFCFSGIPIYGPEVLGRQGKAPSYVDIAVKEKMFTGLRSLVDHPIMIPLPIPIPFLIYKAYDITVEKFIKGSDQLFATPTIQVDLGDTKVLIPEPIAHVKLFAESTILQYPYKLAGELKIKEWFDKLKMLRDVSQRIFRLDVQEAAEEMIEASKKRWGEKGWQWLID